MAEPVFCADCGTESALVLGGEAGLREPHLADAQVWACPLCPDAWCGHNPIAGVPVGYPAGPETREARAILTERQIERLVAEALRGCPGGSAIAGERITGFLAHALGVERADAATDRLSLDQCRAAWRAVARASYGDVVEHAQRYRGVKGKAA